MSAAPYSSGDQMLDDLADRLAAVTGKAPRKSGAGYSLHCPAHEDRTPSLSLNLSDNGERALVNCHGGCDWRDVIAAAGIPPQDLHRNRGTGDAHTKRAKPPAKATVTPIREKAEPSADVMAAVKVAQEAWDSTETQEAVTLASLQQAWKEEAVKALHDRGDVAGIVPQGQRGAGRLRLVYRHPDGTLTGYADRKTSDKQPGHKVIAHGPRNLWPRAEEIPDGTGVVIVEGEADALALWSIGIPAVGVPGAKGWRSEYAQRFARFQSVLVIADADKEGRDLAREVSADVARFCESVEVAEVYPDRTDGSDVRDLLQSGVRVASLPGLRKHLALRPVEATETSPAEDVDTDDPGTFPVWTVADMMKWPEPDPLIHGVLTVGDLFGIVAPFSSGKSAVALDMALRVASGMPWQGRKVEQGAVLYIAAENATGYPKRIMAWGKTNGVDPLGLPFVIITAPMKLNGSRMDDVRLLATVREVERTLGMPVRMVIVDTVRRTLYGNENESETFQAYVDACDRIRTETRAAVGLVHHSPKNADTPGGRGSGVWNDALAPIIALKAKGEPGSITVEASCREPKGGKSPKDLEPFEDMAFHLLGVLLDDTDKYGLPLSGVVAKHGEHPQGARDEHTRRADLVLDTLRTDGSQTRESLLRVIGGRKADALGAIARLVEEGRIVEVGKSGRAVVLGLPADPTAQSTLVD